MSCRHARWSMLAAWVCCVSLTAVAADGLPAAADPGVSDTSASVARIEEVLTQPAEFEFLETPLRDVAEFVSETYQIPVQLDAKALEDAGVTVDTPVTLRIKGIKLESALNLILGQLELDHTIANEVLLITTAEAINNTLETRVYAVSDLLADITSSDGAAKNGSKDLIDLIQAITEPESWDTVGGPGAIRESAVAGAIVCRQTRRAHRQIARLLGDLRRAKQSQSTDQAAANADEARGRVPSRHGLPTIR